MNGELRAALGILILAALAWIGHPVAYRITRPDASAPKVVYAVKGDLLWSPEGKPFRAAAEGHVLDGTGRAVGRVGGWQGMLLGNPLDLNAATQEDLEALPGVGPKLAASIVETRRSLGGFRAVDDLAQVRGIGPKSLIRLKPWLEVRPPGRSP